MGKKDTIGKIYMSDNTRFADAFNYYIYRGEQVIKPDDLIQKDSAQFVEDIVSKEKLIVEQKYRDILKECVIREDNDTTYIFLGIENQSHIDYAMPVRNLLYDAINYRMQISEIRKFHRMNKDLEGDEYLSGISKYDKLKPIITLAIYFGADEWDGPQTLHDMFEIKDEHLLSFINDYRLNIIVPRDVQDSNKFVTDLGCVLELMKYSCNKKQMREFIDREKEIFSNLDVTTAQMIKYCANIDVKIPEKEEVINMCKAFDDMIMDARVETLVNLYAGGYLNADVAANELNISVEDFYEKVNEYKEKVFVEA